MCQRPGRGPVALHAARLIVGQVGLSCAEQAIGQFRHDGLVAIDKIVERALNGGAFGVCRQAVAGVQQRLEQRLLGRGRLQDRLHALDRHARCGDCKPDRRGCDAYGKGTRQRDDRVFVQQQHARERLIGSDGRGAWLRFYQQAQAVEFVGKFLHRGWSCADDQGEVHQIFRQELRGRYGIAVQNRRVPPAFALPACP
ncbi:hypothetical protein D3C85_1151950 [compost metagenome]